MILALERISERFIDKVYECKAFVVAIILIKWYADEVKSWFSASTTFLLPQILIPEKLILQLRPLHVVGNVPQPHGCPNSGSKLF